MKLNQENYYKLLDELQKGINNLLNNSKNLKRDHIAKIYSEVRLFIVGSKKYSTKLSKKYMIETLQVDLKIDENMSLDDLIKIYRNNTIKLYTYCHNLNMFDYDSIFKMFKLVDVLSNGYTLHGKKFSFAYGVIDNIERLNNSINGNPRFNVTIDGDIFTSKSDYMYNYKIDDLYRNKNIVVIKYYETKTSFRIEAITDVYYD